ncbi:MAG: hypothetical protein MN733_14215 [Nitrososphaera sp.]|nr:hypothetical protein [Nitrososphaera sp.]
MSTPGLVLVPAAQNFLDALWKDAPPTPIKFEFGMQYSDQQKYVRAFFSPDDFDHLELLMLTDVQFGHVECNEKRFKEYVDWVLAQPQRFVLLGGDMVDAATVLSVASPYENKYQPREQLLRFCEAIMPIRHRILGYVGGNHERRGTKTFGTLGSVIAMLLKIPYSDGKQIIDIHFGKHSPFKIDLWHGRGASITKGAKAQMLHRFMQQGDSQLYLCGHLHDVIVLFDWRQHRLPRKNEVGLQKIAGAMSSSFLSFWGTYAEVAGLPATDVMMARTILEPNGHWELTLR